MGSILMEPADLMTYADSSYGFKNYTTICIPVDKITSNGLFFDENPLLSSFPLLMLQVVLASTFILLISRLLKQLNQPIIVSQMLGGILMGPMILGGLYIQNVFPLRAFILLDTCSNLGYMLYFFLIGVQVDPWSVKKIEAQTIVTGLSTTFVSLCLSLTCTFYITKFISVDATLERSLPAVAIIENVIAFPMVAQYLSNLNIINSEFGRKAVSSSLVSTVIAMLLQLTLVSQSMKLFFTATAFIAVIVFILRPFILWLMNKTPKGQPVRGECIYTVYLSLLLTAFIGNAMSLRIILGPLVLGLCIPPGPPLGSAILEKLDLITNWVFMPLFFIKNGLVMNFSALDWHKFFAVETIILAATTGKFLGAFLPSIIFKMSIKDAAAMGLIMNGQSVLEVGLFKAMKKNKVISNDVFVLMCISMTVLTAFISPTLKYLYDPSKRYKAYKRRTVMHLKPDSELKMLVSVHNQDNVPAVITLLETVSHSKQNPLYVYAIHLVELVARSNPTLIEHTLTTMIPSSSFRTKTSEIIINAFRLYERKNHEFTSVFLFTATSSYATMHDNVCTLALDQNISLVIIPYHTNFNISDPLQSNKKGYKIVNNNILEKAPCSVGVLIDKDHDTTTRAELRNWSSFRVAVLFLGGSDDREALAIGTRMAGHPNINLTFVRLLEKENLTNHDMMQVMQRNLDDEYVDDFRLRMEENYRVTYIEEVVMDGSGSISVIRSMEEKYELIIVGRRHNKKSTLISGIMDWNERSELGVIGDVFTSADFRGNASVLVVQQHTNVVDEHHENPIQYFKQEPSLKNSKEMEDEEAEHVPIQRRSSTLPV